MHAGADPPCGILRAQKAHVNAVTKSYKTKKTHARTNTLLRQTRREKDMHRHVISESIHRYIHIQLCRHIILQHWFWRGSEPPPPARHRRIGVIAFVELNHLFMDAGHICSCTCRTCGCQGDKCAISAV